MGAGLRAGDADRQGAIEILKAAYADGRLDQDELEQRPSVPSPRAPPPTWMPCSPTSAPPAGH